MCAFGEGVEKSDSNNVPFFNQLNSSKREISSDNLLESLRSSFISRSLPAEEQLLPSLLTNNYQQNKKILSSIEYELESCEAFDFSVAFINDSGLASLLQKLEELREFNVPGRILTTNYLNFTTPGSHSFSITSASTAASFSFFAWFCIRNFVSNRIPWILCQLFWDSSSVSEKTKSALAKPTFFILQFPSGKSAGMMNALKIESSFI